MHRLQVAGVVVLLLGLFLLFLLRGPLYTFIVVAIQLIGIFVALILVVAGIALIFGSGRFRRRPPADWGTTTTALAA